MVCTTTYQFISIWQKKVNISIDTNTWNDLISLKKEGKITFISPSAETATRTFEIEIEADSLIPYPLDEVRLDFEKLDINAEVRANVNNEEIQADYIVCRAFKKLDQIIKISREIVKKPHKILFFYKKLNPL